MQWPLLHVGLLLKGDVNEETVYQIHTDAYRGLVCSPSDSHRYYALQHQQTR